jgi:predicted phosphodiesterase
MLHNLAELDFDPAARGYDAVISGHSHRAREERRGGVLYLNPGAAGPRRFRLPITVALLHVDTSDLNVQVIPLAA